MQWDFYSRMPFSTPSSGKTGAIPTTCTLKRFITSYDGVHEKVRKLQQTQTSNATATVRLSNAIYLILHTINLPTDTSTCTETTQLFCLDSQHFPFSALTLLVGWQEGHPACRRLGVGLSVVIIWLELCTSYSSSCHHHLHHLSSNKIQNGDILVPAFPGCPENGR